MNFAAQPNVGYKHREPGILSVGAQLSAFYYLLMGSNKRALKLSVTIMCPFLSCPAVFILLDLHA